MADIANYIKKSTFSTIKTYISCKHINYDFVSLHNYCDLDNLKLNYSVSVKKVFNLIKSTLNIKVDNNIINY